MHSMGPNTAIWFVPVQDELPPTPTVTAPDVPNVHGTETRVQLPNVSTHATFVVVVPSVRYTLNAPAAVTAFRKTEKHATLPATEGSIVTTWVRLELPEPSPKRTVA